MKAGGSRALYSVAYLVALSLCLTLGRAVAILFGIHPEGSAGSFLGVAVAATFAVGAGFFVEEPLLWARFPGREAARSQSVGESRGTLLTGFAPPPMSLGLALGMFSSLVI
jgi:hypothetical protein